MDSILHTRWLFCDALYNHLHSKIALEKGFGFMPLKIVVLRDAQKGFGYFQPS
jgi:hypothetical protein